METSSGAVVLSVLPDECAYSISIKIKIIFFVASTMQHQNIGILLCILGLSLFANAKLTVHNTAFAKQHYAPVLRMGGPFPVLTSPSKFAPISTAPLLIAEDTRDGKSELIGLGQLSDLNLTDIMPGTVVLLGAGSRWYPQILAFQSLGVQAFIIGFGLNDDAIGFPEYDQAGYEREVAGFKVPFITVPADVLFSLSRSQRNSSEPRAIVSLDDSDGDSPWRKVLSHPAFFAVATAEAVLSCFVCCVCILKLREYKFHRSVVRCSWSDVHLPHICLFLEFIGGALRFFYWSIDPLSSRFVIRYAGHIPFRTVSLPFTLASTLLLTFYWYETVTNTSMTFSLNVERFRIPCYILIACLFLIEIIVDAIYLTRGSSMGVEYANAALYLIVSVFLAGFFLFTTARIIYALIGLRVRARSSQNSGGSTGPKKGKSHLLRISVKIFIGGFSLLLLFLSALLFAVARDFSYSMIPWTVIWLTVHTAANVKAISTIVAFTPRKKDKQSRTSTTTMATVATVAAKNNSGSQV